MEGMEDVSRPQGWRNRAPSLRMGVGLSDFECNDAGHGETLLPEQAVHPQAQVALAHALRHGGSVGSSPADSAAVPRFNGSSSTSLAAASRPSGFKAAATTALRPAYSDHCRGSHGRSSVPAGAVDHFPHQDLTQSDLQSDRTDAAYSQRRPASQKVAESGEALAGMLSGYARGDTGDSLPAAGDEEDLELQAAIYSSMQEEMELRKQNELLVPHPLEDLDKGESNTVSQSGTPSSAIAQTFAPEQWLSDASIACAYGRLAAEGLPEMVLLMDPATAFWLTAQEDPENIAEARGALKIEERELVLCPINDSSDSSRADTGTHWTLLVCWDKRAFAGGGQENGHSEDHLLNAFSYYDSLSNSETESSTMHQANALASRLAGRLVEVHMGTCAKQTNSFDCGVYVLVFSELVAAAFLEARGKEKHLDSHATKTAAKIVAPSKGLGSNHSNIPVWEERLSAVTPLEVEEKRASYFAAFTTPPEQSSGGAVCM